MLIPPRRILITGTNESGTGCSSEQSGRSLSMRSKQKGSAPKKCVARSAKQGPTQRVSMSAPGPWTPRR
jgi:hypothetical protein